MSSLRLSLPNYLLISSSSLSNRLIYYYAESKEGAGASLHSQKDTLGLFTRMDLAVRKLPDGCEVLLALQLIDGFPHKPGECLDSLELDTVFFVGGNILAYLDSKLFTVGLLNC